LFPVIDPSRSIVPARRVKFEFIDLYKMAMQCMHALSPTLDFDNDDEQ
jgi:hypothetical protein